MVVDMNKKPKETKMQGMRLLFCENYKLNAESLLA